MAKTRKLRTEKSKIDPLAEATGGRLRWDDPGMDDYEQGWQEFPCGTRVEVRCKDGVWRKGLVYETHEDNDRAIVVVCDTQWHDNMGFYNGCGATVMVQQNTRRGILSNLRRVEAAS